MKTGAFTWVRRLVWAVFGLAYFLWLGLEDQTVLPVLALGAGLAVALYLEAWKRWVGPPRGLPRTLRAAALGAILGGAVAPLAAVFMLMKVSLHTHAQPDFTAARVLDVLARSPIWAAAGLLVGTGVGLLVQGPEQGNDAHVAPAEAVEYNEQTDGITQEVIPPQHGDDGN